MRYLSPNAFLASLSPYAKLASLDVGTRRIGVAVSDETRRFAFPLKTLERPFSRAASKMLSLDALVKERGVTGFVVGLPLHDGKQTRFCKDVVQLMLDATPNDASFTLCDESNTTVESKRISAQLTPRRSVYLKNKDELSAVLILQRFLNTASPK